ncbi:hypothetical protein RJ640_021123 [Escallonia rubra]|uniref:Plant heme peroxidase family profile domain-containing protein n=1 Tax=Escallonia rubra TaxID=112253 RepID=A0AA88RSB4_9ASTE|nr:hypothetical protein RJ640_021123 [Escallonia rubra]
MLVSTTSYLLPLHKSMQVLGANAAEFMESLSLDGDGGVRTLNFFDCREVKIIDGSLGIVDQWISRERHFPVGVGCGIALLVAGLGGSGLMIRGEGESGKGVRPFNHPCGVHGCFLLYLTHCFGGSEFFLIQGEVRKVLSKGKAAGVLRLVFHDAGTFTTDDNSGGMNGSIVYELDRPENGGLKKSVKASSLYLIIAKAKSGVDIIQPVSWADMIAVAGAEAVSLCGGPQIPVRLGRIDSLVPDPEGKLPEETLDASALKQSFRRKGFSTQELVALSGAHTLGNKGFGNPAAFDNSYFNILLERPWLSSAGMTSMIGLPSDRALVQDDDCLRWISKYANDQNLFFDDFKNAYVKLVNSGARWRKSL